MADDSINVTLHFGVEQDTQGFQNVIRSLDKVKEAAVKNMQLKGFDKVTIDQYKSNIESLKHAIENSWDPTTKTFDLAYAMNLPEAQQALGSMQQIMDGVKISVDETGESFESGGLKIDKYSDKIDHFKLTLANAFRYNVVNRAIDMITNSIRGMIDYVIELDSALNSIRIITGKSSEEMLQFAAANQDTAKQLGRTATEYAQAALIFYQQGLDDSQVEARTNAALKLANITGQTVQETTNQMTAIWNNFDDGVHSLEYYEDVITALGATTASSSKEIAGGLEKFAAIGNTVGLSYEYAASALATVVATTRQSEDVVGTAFKTMFARLQSLKLGETLDDGTTLTKYSKALEDIGVNILDQNGNLKDMDVILDEIGAKWQTLDRNQQTALANTVGGVRQYAQFIALFDNFEFFKENVTTALQSAGTVTKQNEIYMESYGAKIKQIKATLDSIKFDMLGSKDFTALLDNLDKFLVTFRVILKDFGGLNQLLIIGGSLIAQMFLPQLILRFSSEFTKFTNSLKNFKNGTWIDDFKQIFSFKPDTTLTSYFSQLKDSSLSTIKTNELLEKAFHDLGNTGKNQLLAIKQQIDENNNAISKYNNIINQSYDMELNRERITNNLNENGLNSNQSLWIENTLDNWIDSGKIHDIESYVQALQELQIKIQEITGKNITLDNVITPELLLRLKQAKENLDEGAKSADSFLAQWNRLSNIQKVTKMVSAGTIAIRGLYQACEKFQEGDMLGGLAQSFSSLGTAIMMIPGGQIAGGILTAAGTVISVIDAQQKKHIENLKQVRDEYKDLDKQYSDIGQSLEGLMSKYDNLTSKIMLSTTEQEELNNTVDQLSNLLGKDFNLVLYYDKDGNAVLKSLTSIKDAYNELTEARENSAAKARAANEALASTELNKYINQKVDVNENINNLKLLEQAYNDYVNGIDETGIRLQSTMNNIKDMSSLSLDPASLKKAYTKLSSELSENAEFHVDFEVIADYIDFKLEDVEYNIDDSNFQLRKEELKNILMDEFQFGEANAQDLQLFLNVWPQIVQNEDFENAISGDKDAIDRLIESLDVSGPTAQTFIDIMSSLSEEIERQNELLTEQQMSLEGVIEQINNAINAYEALNEAYKEINENGEASIDTISKIAEQFKDVDGIDELVESLLIGKITLGEFEEASQKLWNSYVYGLPILQNVTAENFNAVVAYLERIGVTNATEVAQWALDNSTKAVKKSTTDAANATPKLSEGLQDNKSKSDKAKESFDKARESLFNLRNGVRQGTGKLDVSGVTGPLSSILIWVQRVQTALSSLGVFFKGKGGSKGTSVPGGLGYVNNVVDPVPETPPDAGAPDVETPYDTSPGGSGGGGSKGSKGSGSGTEDYKAQLTGYEKIEDELEIIGDRLERNKELQKNTKDLQEQIKLKQQENELLKQQQNKLHELNDLRRKDLEEYNKSLTDMGFIIQYNADTQELMIENYDHIHELTGEEQKTAEEMIKSMKDLNEETQKSSKLWRENEQAIKDSKEEIDKILDTIYKDTQNDKLFFTMFYEGLESGLPTLRKIYLDVIDNAYKYLNELYAKGYTDADDVIQSVWKEIMKYQKEIKEIDNDIFENQIKYIDRILDILPDIPETYDERMELVQKRIELRNERINELMVKGTEEALNQVMDLLEDQAKDIEKRYKLMINNVKQQQDELKDAIDGVVALIDKEIDKLKEEQEAQKKINEEKEKDIELMKLKANLENARHQKTVLTYRKGEGFVWEANRKAIKEAEKAINDFNKKNEKDELQERIDSLEEYKKSWKDIPNVIEEEEKISAALLKFGTDGIKDILDMRGEYQKQSLDEYRGYTQEMNALTNEMNTQLIGVQDTIEEVQQRIIDFQENANNNINNNQHRIFYADKNGIAPPESREGDIIITADGKGYLRTPHGYEGSNVSEKSGYSSILLENLKQLIYKPELAGKEETNQDFVNGLFEGLSDKFDFLNEVIPIATDGVTNSTNAIANMDKTIELLNTNMGTYTNAMVEVAKTSQELVKVSSMYTNQSEIFKNQSQDSAKDSKYYSDKSQEIYNNILNVVSEGSQHHQGLEVGPVGSQAGQRAFNSNFMRIARGDLKNDEIFGLLKKGEAVFTPEQLENMVNALNYSLNSIDKLSTLNNKMFNLGQMNNINNQIPVTDSPSQSINFGDINIQMYGVNDLDNFAFVLKNNVKSIFAQTLAKE